MKCKHLLICFIKNNQKLKGSYPGISLWALNTCGAEFEIFQVK